MDSFHLDLLKELKKFYLFENTDDKILKSLTTQVTHQVLSKGEVLFEQGTPSDALYFVIKGRLQAVLTEKAGHQIMVDEIGIGEIVGEMQILVGGKRTASVNALSQTELLKLPKVAFEQLLEQCPNIVKKMHKVMIQRSRHDQLLTILPQFFSTKDRTILKKIETQIEWVHLCSGEALFHQGDRGDSLYIVISGRLQAIVENEEGERQIVGEISRAESVGEMNILENEDRIASIYALRDCELIKITKSIFQQVIKQHPEMMTPLTQIIIRRLKNTIQKSQIQNNSTAINIAIVPVNPKIRLSDFCHHLVTMLSVCDSVLHLNSERLDDLMEIPGVAQLTEDNPQSLRLIAWLDQQEINHHFTLYETDSTATPWTKWCLKRADKIILVADATASPEWGEIEKTCLKDEESISTASQILVLLHPDEQKLPSGTQAWLSKRQVKTHHHIRWDNQADFGRLARFLSGRAVGLVLSGGGARGFVHFGVYLALKEAGIPVDMIGGTSIGGHIGAQCAAEWDRETMLRINRKGLIELNPYKAYQFPFVSLLRGMKMKESSTMAFGETQIEDLWINFFCISSNLSTYQMKIHQQGDLEKAIRATTAIPGIAEPILEKGDLLIDGGILNNLPGDIMREFCGTVILVDIAGQLNLKVEYDRIPSPWEILWHRIWPFKKSFQLPSLLDILLGATLLSSNDRAKMVKKEADFYLKPPVRQFKMLEFSALDKLVEVGYQYTKTEIENWQNTNIEKWKKIEPWVPKK